ncbi:MAG: polyphosphate kinase 2 family protein [Clostridiales bacterium]|nr:polyphosphate kinase 2 family protein [Clostridiales bacterium]
MDIARFKISEDTKFRLSDIETEYKGKEITKDEAERLLLENVGKMAMLQDKLYAQDKYALLVIVQGMDTAGKDGMIGHVMSGLNPQGTQVYSFKQPTYEDLNHDYLWRVNKCLPERGHIGIFNRSYYEEVLVVKVHNLIESQGIPHELITSNIWEKRYKHIRNYEEYLVENGIIPIKIFLHISKDEQKKRLLERIDDKEKNWKFSSADLKERGFWDQYQKCYQELIRETGVKHAPWYVVPADDKWYARLVVSEIIIKALKKLKLEYPELMPEQLDALDECRRKLLGE